MTEEWYYHHGGEQHGPVNAEELRTLAVRRQIQPTDLVWNEVIQDWVPAGTLKGLFPNFESQARNTVRTATVDATLERAERVSLFGRRLRAATGASATGKILAPSSLCFALLLFSLPWLTVSCNGREMLTQSGWQACYGGFTLGPQLQELAEEMRSDPSAEQGSDGPGVGALVCLAAVFALAGVVFGVLVFFGKPRFGLPNGAYAYAFCGVAAFLLLSLQLFRSFPVEQEIRREEAKKRQSQSAPPDFRQASIEGMSRMLNAAMEIRVKYTLWFWLAYGATLAPAGFAFAEYYRQRSASLTATR